MGNEKRSFSLDCQKKNPLAIGVIARGGASDYFKMVGRLEVLRPLTLKD